MQVGLPCLPTQASCSGLPAPSIRRCYAAPGSRCGLQDTARGTYGKSMSQPDPLTFAEAFPSVPPEERLGAETRLRRYLELVVQIADRCRAASESLGRGDTDENPLTNEPAPRTLAFSEEAEPKREPHDS